MENPFVYGEVVPRRGVRRTARPSSTAWSRTSSAAQKVFLISPRRYGKSSLVRQALGTLSRAAAR